MEQSNSSLTFVVRRQPPEVIVPASPTPRELKPLSDIDHQEGFRYHVPAILFYPHNSEMGDKNPASVIKEALAKLLVFYYPFAGRLKEVPGKKLMVDCSEQGALFIEAEADVTLKEFGETLRPPFPCLEDLLYDLPIGFGEVLDSPLLLVQVTRLSCGGFIFASRMIHTIADGPGAIQFLTALGEMTMGAVEPSILPVWQREFLFARDPPYVTFPHREYDEMTHTNGIFNPTEEMIEKSFFFGPSEMSAIRRFVPENLKNCSTFEALAACVWRCRTIALQPDPKAEMRFLFPVNARNRFNPPVPIGYYGNCIVIPCVISTAEELSNKPLGYAIELVMKTKSVISEEYVRSTCDLTVIKGRPVLNLNWAYFVSNLTRAVGFKEINFGWGKAIYGGPATGGVDFLPGLVSYYMSTTNNIGEVGIMVPLCMPSAAMDKFVDELNKFLK